MLRIGRCINGDIHLSHQFHPHAQFKSTHLLLPKVGMDMVGLGSADRIENQTANHAVKYFFVNVLNGGVVEADRQVCAGKVGLDDHVLDSSEEVYGEVMAEWYWLREEGGFRNRYGCGWRSGTKNQGAQGEQKGDILHCWLLMSQDAELGVSSDCQNIPPGL
jgi:hypothetical protein